MSSTASSERIRPGQLKQQQEMTPTLVAWCGIAALSLVSAAAFAPSPSSSAVSFSGTRYRLQSAIPTPSSVFERRVTSLSGSRRHTFLMAAGCTAVGEKELRDAETTTTTTTSFLSGEAMPWTLNDSDYGPFNQEYWAWAYTSVPEDSAACSSYECMDVEGSIPDDLTGVYYRAGPGNFERGQRRYEHALDGDGFLSKFIFSEGKCQYRGRFVETEYFLKEKQANKVLFRNVFGTQRDDGLGPLDNAFDVNLKNVANTNALEFGGRLFVFWEAGRPYELNPDTLETLPLICDNKRERESKRGPHRALGNDDSMRGVTLDEGGPIDMAMNLGRSFTAHPHVVVDDGNGESTLVAFKSGQNLVDKSIRLEFVEYDEMWREKKNLSGEGNVKYSLESAAAPPHDFALSQNYYAIYQNHFEIDTLGFILGQKAPTQAMQMMLDKPCVLHLVPRRNNGDGNLNKPIQVEVPKYFNIHMVPKVFEEELVDDETGTVRNHLVVYSNGWDLTDGRFFEQNQERAPFLGSWGGDCPDYAGGVVPPALLYRTVVDADSGALISHQEVVPGLVMEFPMQDENDPNIVYCSAASADYSSMPGTGFVKVDLASGKAQYWWAEHKIFTGEMHPVKKNDGSSSGSWLLTIMYDAGRKGASFAIFDSEKLEDGPVCRIHLPHALAYSLHGSFTPQASASATVKENSTITANDIPFEGYL